MKIRSIAVRHVLHYEAFQLNLDHGGLHILHGPNETGKSTLLTLIMDLLFGGAIAESFRDHYDSHSRLEGVIERSDQVLYRIERKRRYNRLVLTDADHTELPEDALARYLGGYTREPFALLFGFDHERLRAGGQSLLDSQGQAGISLFEAGGGIQYLTKLLGTLADRSAQLLDPSFNARSAKELNKQWRSFIDTQKSLKQSSLRAEEWHRQRQEIFLSEQRAEQLERQLADADAAWQKVTRLLRVRPMISEWLAMKQELEELGPASVSPHDEENILTLLKKHGENTQSQARAEDECRRQAQRAHALHPDPQATSLADSIERLSEGLMQFLSLRDTDLPAAREQRQKRKAETEQRLQELSPGTSWAQIDQLRLPLTALNRIDTLAEEIAGAHANYALEKAQREELIEDSAKVEKDLEALGPIYDVSHLSGLIRTIREEGNVQRKIAQAERDIELKQQAIDQRLRQQTLYAGSPRGLKMLPLPLHDTVERYAGQWASLEQERSEARRNHQTLRAAALSLANDLEVLDLQGEVPVPSDLLEARSLREEAWTRVKQSWLHHELPEGVAPQDLADDFAQRLANADRVVDAMRREADRSANRALLLMKQEQTKQALAHSAKRRRSLDIQFSQLETLWAGEWQPCGILPKSPGEMREWLSAFHAPLVLMLGELDASEAHRAELAQHQAQLRQALATAAQEAHCQAGDALTLNDALEQCENYARVMGERDLTRRTLWDQRRVLETKIHARTQSLTKWEQQLQLQDEEWESVLRAYPSLPPRPQDALHYSQHLRELLRGVQEIEQMETAIRTSEEICHQFERQALAVAEQLGENLAEAASVESWVRQARQRMHNARETEQLLQSIEDEQARLRGEADQHGAEAGLTAQQLQHYQAQCHAADLAQLSAQVEISRQRRNLAEEKLSQERRIRQAADGMSVDAIVQSLEELGDPDTLESQKIALEARQDGIRGDIAREKDHLQTLQTAFAHINETHEAAAAFAQQGQQHLAEVDRLWNEYLRVELARRLLERSIEEFRERNESAILHRAGQLFRRMTLRQYEELLVEYDGSAPYLLAVHADGSRRRVFQLSDGTRDQLFLSLRLAFVEQHLAGSEPLPLVMDDILVHFDDARTQATLEVLHELGQQTQILYFTHHQSVVDQAQQLAAHDHLHVHYLRPQQPVKT